MPSAVKSAFDVAFWFLDTAMDQNEYLQPQKLHRLLYLAQGYYAVASRGRRLMPSIFVADDLGPIEPNVYAAFAKGRPDIEVELFLSGDVEGLLENVWWRFGHHSAEHLTRMTKDTVAYQQAHRRGRRTEIHLDAMRLSFARAEETPAVEQVVKPKIRVSQSGKPVNVKAWVPGAKPVRGR